MQETILTCFEKIKDLKEPRFFKTWLIRILINNCNDMLKKQKRTIRLEESIEKSETYSYEDEIAFDDLMQLLDDKYRIVITLFYVERFKISEIAEILEVSENTVKTRLTRGRKEFAYHYNVGNNDWVGGQK